MLKMDLPYDTTIPLLLCKEYKNTNSKGYLNSHIHCSITCNVQVIDINPQQQMSGESKYAMCVFTHI